METKIKGKRLKKMRIKKKLFGIMTTVLYVLVKNIKTAEMKMAYKTISKTDKIALKLTTEPSDPKINPEEYIQYSTKNPKLAKNRIILILLVTLEKTCAKSLQHTQSLLQKKIYT